MIQFIFGMFMGAVLTVLVLGAIAIADDSEERDRRIYEEWRKEKGWQDEEKK